MLTFYNQAKVLLYIDKVENNQPVFLEVHPSMSCNHACVWCRYGKDSEKLDYETMVGALKTYPGVKGVRITGGGEPLTNKKAVLEFIRACAGQGISTGIETNGGLLDREAIDVIGRYCTYCRISLDAATAQTHEKLHRAEGFEAILDSISQLKQMGTKELGVSFLVVRENVQEILKIPELRLPVDYVHFKPLIQGIDEKSRSLALLMMKHWETAGFQPHIRYDRLERDDSGNLQIPCRITKIIRVLGGNSKEYVCCEHAYEDDFECSTWNGSTRRCYSCRYNGYNEILESYYKNTMRKEFL